MVSLPLSCAFTLKHASTQLTSRCSGWLSTSDTLDCGSLILRGSNNKGSVAGSSGVGRCGESQHQAVKRWPALSASQLASGCHWLEPAAC